jgi:DnaJ-class molecular chaperone
MNVEYTVNITIEDLLAGFKKQTKLYNDAVTICSEKYFNPNKRIIIKDKGLYHMKKQRNGDLYIKFKVEFTDSERLGKYNDVIQKILKKTSGDDSCTETDAHNVFCVQKLQQ